MAVQAGGDDGKLAPALVCDSKAIGDVWREELQARIGLHPLRRCDVRDARGAIAMDGSDSMPRRIVLVVARFAPENNIDLTLDAVAPAQRRAALHDGRRRQCQLRVCRSSTGCRGFTRPGELSRGWATSVINDCSPSSGHTRLLRPRSLGRRHESGAPAGSRRGSADDRPGHGLQPGGPPRRRAVVPSGCLASGAPHEKARRVRRRTPVVPVAGSRDRASALPVGRRLPALRGSPRRARTEPGRRHGHPHTVLPAGSAGSRYSDAPFSRLKEWPPVARRARPRHADADQPVAPAAQSGPPPRDRMSASSSN